MMVANAAPATASARRSRVWRWLRNAALLLVLLGVVVLIAVSMGLRGSLARLEGSNGVAGLSGPATVERDANGTVTVSAANAVDAARAMGFVHGQERPFEMDMLRRASAGELSALFGPAAVEVDRAHRLYRLRERMQRQVQSLDADHLAQLRAYAEGVNAGVAALRVRPWPYLLLRQQPAPWRPEDSLLVGMAMYFDLQDSSGQRKQALWRMQDTLPPALYRLLTHGGTSWDAPVLGGSLGDPALPGADEVDLRKLAMPAKRRDTSIAIDITPGSNNFAVGGKLTADGRAILANDMHLGLRAPNIWFRARLRYPDATAPGGHVDATGFSLPGLPFLIVGSNGHVAWGFTNSYVDTVDLQAAFPCTGERRSDCVQLTRRPETLQVAGQPDQTYEIEESSWGPVLSHEADGRVLMVRWTAAVDGAMTPRLADMVRARDLDDALRIARTLRIPAQNMLLADRHGRIAWHMVGALPQRRDACDPMLPVQPTTCHPWPVDNAGAPESIDPESSRLWTANNRNVDGATLARVGDGGFALAARARQIRDDLFAASMFDEKTLLAVQLDDRAVFLQRWRELLLKQAAATGQPHLKALLHVARQPMHRAAVDSGSYAIVRAWRLAVLSRLADGLTAPAQATLGQRFTMPNLQQFEGVAWPLATQQPMHLLPRRFVSWNALFEDAAAEVERDLSTTGPLARHRWGQRNTAKICHPLVRALPFAKQWLCMPPDPLDGDTAMPHVAAPSFGASERMVVSPGHEADGIAHMPGGQSGHPLSPFWGSGHADWVHGRATPFLPGVTRYTLQLQPE